MSHLDLWKGSIGRIAVFSSEAMFDCKKMKVYMLKCVGLDDCLVARLNVYRRGRCLVSMDFTNVRRR